MAYMNQEQKSVIKANLDKILKPLGIKYSLSVQHHSTILCTLRSGPIDFFGDCTAGASHARDYYLQCNLYHIENNYKNPSKDILLAIKDALQSANYFDHSDSQTDYFHCAYYYYCNVGAWDKPYVLTNNDLKVAA